MIHLLLATAAPAIRVADWPKPTAKKWRVPADLVVRDDHGNICVNPHDKTGLMFVAAHLVEITE